MPLADVQYEAAAFRRIDKIFEFHENGGVTAIDVIIYGFHDMK